MRVVSRRRDDYEAMNMDMVVLALPQDDTQNSD